MIHLPRTLRTCTLAAALAAPVLGGGACDVEDEFDADLDTELEERSVESTSYFTCEEALLNLMDAQFFTQQACELPPGTPVPGPAWDNCQRALETLQWAARTAWQACGAPRPRIGDPR